MRLAIVLSVMHTRVARTAMMIQHTLIQNYLRILGTWCALFSMLSAKVIQSMFMLQPIWRSKSARARSRKQKFKVVGTFADKHCVYCLYSGDVRFLITPIFIHIISFASWFKHIPCIWFSVLITSNKNKNKRILLQRRWRIRHAAMFLAQGMIYMLHICLRYVYKAVEW